MKALRCPQSAQHASPVGADVYVKAYDDPEAQWLPIGKSPIENFLLLLGYYRWKAEKTGFGAVERGAGYQSSPIEFVLDREGTVPFEMVHVPHGEVQLFSLNPVHLDETRPMQHPEREQERSPERTEGRGSDSRERHEVRGRDGSYRLSDDELRTLRTVGTFRTVNAKDMPADHIKHLVSSGLMERSTIPSTDKRMDVLVLSREGKRILTDRQPLNDEQRFHSGLVKLRELEHDAAIYPAFRDRCSSQSLHKWSEYSDGSTPMLLWLLQ